MSAKKRLTKKQRKKLLGLALALVIIAAAGIMTLAGGDISPLVEAFPALGDLLGRRSLLVGGDGL